MLHHKVQTNASQRALASTAPVHEIARQRASVFAQRLAIYWNSCLGPLDDRTQHFMVMPTA
jgi:hypothetical protein